MLFTKSRSRPAKREVCNFTVPVEQGWTQMLNAPGKSKLTVITRESQALWLQVSLPTVLILFVYFTPDG